jgi:hypothetical protein
MASSCEHGNEYWGSIKGGEFLDQFSHGIVELNTEPEKNNNSF